MRRSKHIMQITASQDRNLSKLGSWISPSSALKVISVSTWLYEVLLSTMMRSSTIKWVSRFPPKQCPQSANPPNLSPDSSLRWAKPSLFDGNGTKSPLNNQITSSKMLSLTGFRVFSTNGKSRDRRSTEAEAALLDYLHGMRELDFTIAEHMSKNSPIFLNNLLGKVGKDEEVARSLRRFFVYHPVNEFEPFFESLGLEPSEYDSLLRSDLMFLSDDQELLENSLVLCNYGIARGKIGRILKEATEIFRYKKGMLELKLWSYEELCLSKSSIIKIVTSAPTLLIGEVDRQFVKVLEALEGMGIERDWIGGVLYEKSSYNWGRMLTVLRFFFDIGFTKEQLGIVVKMHPDFVLDGSGKTVFSLVALMLKLGRTRSEMFSLFSRFPNMRAACFRRNLLHGLLFLIEIEMEPEDIQRLLCTHTEVFGTCSLRKANSIISYLNIGKKRLCQIIKENPYQLENFVYGVKIECLPNTNDVEKQLAEKRNFLLRLGFTDDSQEMKKALTVFRGKGNELQDRYDFLVKIGLEPEDVTSMIKTAPHILNQKINSLQSKIDFLVNNLGYPLRALVLFPAYMSYTVERVNIRFLMFNWLKERGLASPTSAMSSFVACSDNQFTEKYLRRHPEALEVWKKFKKG